MKTIYLLYFDGCPNVTVARQNLRSALSRAGLTPIWEEINLQGGDAPERWRGFPSPTILVAGRDIVSGADSAGGSGACRFGGAPSVEVILSHLNHGTPGSWFSGMSTLPAIVMGAWPALFCPACYPALVGLLSALGLGALATDAVLKPLMIAFLLVANLGLWHGSKRSRQNAPLILGSAGSIGIYVSVFMIVSPTLKVLSIVLLIAASIWNAIPVIHRTGIAKSCSSCQSDKKEDGPHGE